MPDAPDPFRLLVDGEAGAWDEAVLASFGRIRSFFVNKVGDDASELTQRTFDRLQTVRGAYQGQGTARGYVLGIAKFVLLEYMRERYRNPAVPLEEVSVAAVDPRPSSVLVARAEQRLVLEALRRLSLDHQIVLELYYWEDMSDREIAEVTGTNENTVRGRRTRARERMRALLAELEGEAVPRSTSMDCDKWARSIRAQAGVSSSA